MEPENILQERAVLQDWANTVHGRGHGGALSRSDFLQTSWDALSGLVRWNKQNPLIKEAVKAYPDLIPRAFTILSVLYGAYTAPPEKIALLKDFIALLDKDLIEEEMVICAYAKTNGAGAFFPELGKTLEMIHAVYGAEHFDLTVLPPTPYQAYALYVLNCTDFSERTMGTEELFGHLSVINSKMKKGLALAQTSAPSEASGGQPH